MITNKLLALYVLGATIIAVLATRHQAAQRRRGDEGMTTLEVAAITGGLLVAAGILVVAAKGKVEELIGNW